MYNSVVYQIALVWRVLYAGKITYNGVLIVFVTIPEEPSTAVFGIDGFCSNIVVLLLVFHVSCTPVGNADPLDIIVALAGVEVVSVRVKDSGNNISPVIVTSDLVEGCKVESLNTGYPNCLASKVLSIPVFVH